MRELGCSRKQRMLVRGAFGTIPGGIHNPKERVVLVLSRGESEQVRIGENIIVTVVRLQGNKVRLGFDAPSSVEIVRCELDLDGTEPTDIIRPDELEDGE